LTRSSKLHVSRVVFYWAILSLGLLILWTFVLNALEISGIGPALSLAVPMILGAILSVSLYLTRDRQVLEYDDEGYSIIRGRRTPEDHKWNEFKECSVAKDSWGRNKVRLYVSRDGQHADIDSSACGVDSYKLRDFILARLSNERLSEQQTSRVFDGLEREIQRGRASWVADLNETFKSYQASGEVFPLMARGGTRPKGFLLSRFLAVTVMPSYEVALYAYDVSGPDKVTKSRVMRLVRVIMALRDEKNIKWSWLVLVCDEEPPPSVSSLIEEFGNKDIGIGCIDVNTGRLITSSNQLGRSLSRQMRLHHLIRDLNRSRRWREARS
jgi:hypothetical protein